MSKLFLLALLLPALVLAMRQSMRDENSTRGIW